MGTHLDFAAFVRLSEARASTLSADQLDASTEPLLNGQPYKRFRNSFSIDDRRRIGAFFSSQETAKTVAKSVVSLVESRSVVMDPCCGIGDLLLSYAEHLPVRETLEGTLILWGNSLAGMDIQPDLIRLTKARLVAMARLRGGFGRLGAPVHSFFPSITKGSFLRAKKKLRLVDAFLFNPPYVAMQSGGNPNLPSGKVNSAALYLDHLVENMSSHSVISAVLPEVLRCGSNYEKFVVSLESRGIGGNCLPLGRFDKWVDVDVFHTLLSRSEKELSWSARNSSPDKTIGDNFEVRIGPVVDTRDERRGPNRLFVCAKTTPRWCSAYQPTTRRRFSGTVFNPPFVVLRRTSRPTDKHRAVATIITANEPVAVENHLIVLTPRSKSISDCEKVLKLLKHYNVSTYLNRTMRCRHLTKGSIERVPLGLGH